MEVCIFSIVKFCGWSVLILHQYCILYGVFSHDVMAAILLEPKTMKQCMAMLVFQTIPVGVDFFSYVNTFFVPINLLRT